MWCPNYIERDEWFSIMKGVSMFIKIITCVQFRHIPIYMDIRPQGFSCSTHLNMKFEPRHEISNNVAISLETPKDVRSVAKQSSKGSDHLSLCWSHIPY